MFLTQDASVPIGSAQPFATYADVATWFGALSNEAVVAKVYFSGFDGCDTLPGTLYFAQFNTVNVAAYLRSGSLAGLTLTQLKALTGPLSVTIDGVEVTATAVDLTAATSFTNAATLLSASLQNPAGVFSGTASQTAAAGVMDVTAVVSGELHVGDLLTGTAVDAGLTIVSFGTGTGGIGTYNVSTQTGFAATAVEVASAARVTYDPLRQAFLIMSGTTGAASTVSVATGTLAPLLGLTVATGAVLSAGADVAVPATAMNGLIASTQNFATFMTVDEQPIATKMALGEWVTGMSDRYLFVCPDSDITAIAANAAASFGVLSSTFDGVAPVYDTSGQSLLGAFICGAIASIDFTARNGRITLAGKSQAGLAAQVTNATQADNLKANGYNWYGAYATANQGFVMLQPGQMSGAWKWIDPYINQIALNAALQLALVSLLKDAKAIPYNAAGYNLVRAGCLGSINDALAFGSIEPGVALSPVQAAEVNLAAGVKIDQTLQNTGWYLQVLDPGAVVRGQRGSPNCRFFYTDAGSIQRIDLSSVDIA